MSGQAPAGWYPDPTAPGSQRYWDGNAWAAPSPAAQVPAQPLVVQAVPAKTNGLAIASLVLSILWMGGVGSVAAIVMGFIARGQIRERRESGDGLALAGIIIGFVGLAAAAFFMFIVLGIFSLGSTVQDEFESGYQECIDSGTSQSVCESIWGTQ